MIKLLSLTFTIIATGCALAAEPSLEKELQPLEWMIGEWELSTDFHQPKDINSRLPHFGKYFAYVSGVHALTSFQGMKVKPSEDGNELHVIYSYETADERLPFPGVASTHEVISWSSDKECFKIVCKVWRLHNERRMGEPNVSTHYLKSAAKERWRPLHAKPDLFPPQVEIQKLGDDRMLKTVVCEMGRASLRFERIQNARVQAANRNTEN